MEASEALGRFRSFDIELPLGYIGGCLGYLVTCRYSSIGPEGRS
jgi:hypothetical protein